MSGHVLWLVAATAAGSFVALLAILRLLGRPRNPAVRLEPIPEAPAETLVVIAHGFGGRKSIAELSHVAAETFPRAHILAPDYDARLPSNADVYEITDEIEKVIARWDARHRYQRIVLIGHSAGGVLLRKVYVWARDDDDRPAERTGRSPWIDRVDRIVLLAAVNRGWSFEQRPEKMPRFDFVCARIADRIARIAGVGKLIHSVERGHPYIADLRMQWMHVVRAGPTPPVFQLLGGEDEIVAKEDSRDVSTAENFVFLDAGVNTTHADILQFHRDATDPDLRERGRIRLQAFCDALTKSPEELRAHATDATFARYPEIERVIFIKHGIRDLGAWTEKFREAIAERDPHARVVTARYGLFPMASFLLFNARQAKVRQFVDEYTEMVALYPNAKEISYFGHSNGTYLLASALERYRTIFLHRVVFAGSVVQTDYPWERYVPARVNGVQNLVGSADWIVGIFPGFYQGVRRFFGMSKTGFFDIGSAGFRGFEKADHATNIEYVNGGHGAGFGPSDANIGPIADYLTNGSDQIAVVNKVADIDLLVDQASKFSLLVWLLLVGFIVSVGWLLAQWWPPAAFLWAASIVLVLNVV